MASLVLNGNTSGSVTISSPSVSGTTTLTLPVQTGTVMVNGPAFSAYANSTDSFTNDVARKVSLSQENFDTNSNYDTSTYRFTPTVAGYYQITVGCAFTTTQTAELLSTVYKNGSRFKTVFDMEATSWGGYGTVLVYANGSTDYFEFFIYSASAGTKTITGNARDSYFQAAMVRSA